LSLQIALFYITVDRHGDNGGDSFRAFGDVVDIEAALSVLSQNLTLAGLPDGVVIAVLEDDYVVRWPADRAGEPLEE
jgi:hypothetical protein